MHTTRLRKRSRAWRFVWGFVLGLALVAVWFLAGCAGGGTEVRPGRTQITQQVERRLPDGTIETERANAESVGASLKSSTADGSVAAEFNGTAPEVDLPGIGSARGGSAQSDVKLTGRAKSGLLVFAGLFAMGGVACLAVGMRKSGWLLFGVAGVTIAAYALSPVWLGVAFLLLVAGVIVLGWSALRNKEGLRAVVAGVESTPLGSQVKEEIAKHADEFDRRVIRRIKEQDGF